MTSDVVHLADSTDTTVLALHQVSKSYRRGSEFVKALRAVELDLHRGEVVALMGPSGSGKSTLLAVSSGIEPVDEGQVELDGVTMNGLPPSERARLRRRAVGIVFQDFHLLPTLTVAENIELPLLLDRQRGRASAVDEQLEGVGLTHRAAHYPHELSGGERQRVAIARARILDPPCLMADEPTGNLDVETAMSIVELLIMPAREGTTGLLLVTHNPEIAVWADRTLHMREGVLADHKVT